MFDKPYEQRLQTWREFRHSLEYSHKPFDDVVEFYSKAPTMSLHIDITDSTSWPTPWELLLDNQYCDFGIVLGMCYSLQLTERFKGLDFEIHIGIDSASAESYHVLVVNDMVLGFNNSCVALADLPQDFVTRKISTVPKLQ